MRVTCMDSRIGTAELPPYHYKRLILWAFCDRKSKAALAKDVLVARIEANQRLIDDKIADYAAEYGLTVEQLLERVYKADQDKLSVAQLHKQLEEEFRGTGGSCP